MAQRMPESYRIDPADPRAPSAEQWARMSPEERARVVAMLPGKVPMERAQAEAERAQAEAERAQAQAERAAAAEARIKELEQQLAEVRAEMERLRRGG